MDASGLFEEERITSITAVVGDNDFMHHKVEGTGAPGVKAPARLSIDSTLDFDGEAWRILEGVEVLERYTEEQLRLSLSWRANVYDASSSAELFGPAARKRLIARWPGFRPD